MILVGHSTGGGEVTRNIGRQGTGRVAKAVLLGAIPPLILKTEANPGGTPIEAFDDIRAGPHPGIGTAYRAKGAGDLRVAQIKVHYEAVGERSGCTSGAGVSANPTVRARGHPTALPRAALGD